MIVSTAVFTSSLLERIYLKVLHERIYSMVCLTSSVIGLSKLYSRVLYAILPFAGMLNLIWRFISIIPLTFELLYSCF